MARPKQEDEREIRELVAEGEAMSREQLAAGLLQWLSQGDLRGYAESVRARLDARRKEGAIG